MTKTISYPDILEENLTIEFFKGSTFGNEYQYAMIRIGDHGYLAGNGADGVFVKPTVEFANHFKIEAVGGHLTFLLDLALKQGK